MSGSAAAPGELELVRAFVNTLDVESGEDALAAPGALELWLAERGLLSRGVAARPAEARRALAVREALRSLLAANNGGRPDGGAARVLDSAAGRAGLSLRFAPEGSAGLQPRAGGVDGAVGWLLAIVADAMAAGSWARLKACRAEGCRWVFYDRARNRSRAWCSMAVCGNRAKARAHRERGRGRGG